MITIEFLPKGGGKRAFRSREKLREHLTQQYEFWWKLRGELGPPRGSEFGSRISSAWNSVASQLDSISADLSDEDLSTQITGIVQLGNLIADSSIEGQAIQQALEDLGPAAASGAVMAATSNPNEQIGVLYPAEVSGALHYLATVSGLSKRSAGAARRSFDGIISKLGHLYSENETALVSRDQAQQGQFKEFSDEFRRLIDGISTYRTDTEKDVGEQRAGWQREWEEAREQFTNELTLRGPVRLWAGRAHDHRKSAAGYRKAIGWIGAIGLFATLFILWPATVFVRWLIGSVLLVSEPPSPAKFAIATGYELAALAAVGLLCLTLYLWSVRLAVRLYLTEHHLAIDASARAAMAHTYLALTKKGAAADADRAIVLASLFRPIADGVVKDDASPGLSPASLLSAQLSSFNGKA